MVHRANLLQVAALVLAVTMVLLWQRVGICRCYREHSYKLSFKPWPALSSKSAWRFKNMTKYHISFPNVKENFD